MKSKCTYLFILFFHSQVILAQNVLIENQKFIYFPHPLNHKWVSSIGITATTMPYEVTEELHYRIPAIDFHVLKKINNKFLLAGRINSQILQSLIMIGPHWNTKLSERISMSIGDEVGYWFGSINVQGFRTRGTGWQNYPQLSLGYRFNKQILLTLRADALMTLDIKTHAGENQVTTNFHLFSGSSYTVALEQPFYGKKSLTLGFRAIYTNFFWQTWTAFENFDRNLFYPQLIVGLIL